MKDKEDLLNVMYDCEDDEVVNFFVRVVDGKKYVFLSKKLFTIRDIGDMNLLEINEEDDSQ